MRESTRTKYSYLIGKRNGKLVVKEIIDMRYEKRTIVGAKCVCDCGEVYNISLNHFLHRTNLSCGCDLREKKSKSQIADLSGKRFGRLLVLSQTPRILTKYVEWECLCDCGNRCRVKTSQLKSGKTQSCGCLQKENTKQAVTKDLTGYVSPNGIKFISQYSKKKIVGEAGVWIWNCLCPYCGDIFQALPAKVFSNHIMSCGCQKSSNQELIVTQILNNMHVDYKREFRFDECRSIYPLPFDFVIFRKEAPVLAIEIQGRQHYNSVDYFGGEKEFEYRKRKDAIKRSFCSKRNIPLLELPYYLKEEELEKEIYNAIYRNDCDGFSGNKGA